jgi:homoserine dehydrogenase
VVSDIIDVAKNIASGNNIRIPMNYYSSNRTVDVCPQDSVTSRYYLRFTVTDKPKVLASIASYLGEQGISIASVMQKEGYSDNSVPVIILTHSATEQGIRTAVSEIEKTKVTRDKTQIIRIVD